MAGYEVPELVDSPYNDEFGWAPGQNQGVPDSYRLGNEPVRDFQEGPVSTTEFHAERDAETKVRESDTLQQSTPYSVTPLEVPRFAPDPRTIPVAPSRQSATLRPSYWSFIRDMLGGTPKEFNGVHFSMADHYRNYDILGMQPAKSARSTYRQDAGPNLSVVDMPPNEPRDPSGTILAVRTPNINNAFRLT